ncbi:MAG: hypothetical protein QM703_05880 [Gemmatales bacterium]
MKSQRITGAEIKAFEPIQRCVWGAICAEALTRLYSDYFQKLFETDTAYSLVWSYVSSGTVDLKETKRYLRKCSRLSKSSEAYEYGLPNSMLGGLVGELLSLTGDSVIDCIGQCGRLYPQILFFNKGIDDRIIGLNPRHIDNLTSQYHAFTRSVLRAVVRNKTNHSRENYLSRLRLDASAFKLPRGLYLQKPSTTGRPNHAVPVHELRKAGI